MSLPYGADLPMRPEAVHQQIKGITDHLGADPAAASEILRAQAKMIEEAGVLQSDEEIRKLMVEATAPIMDAIERIASLQTAVADALAIYRGEVLGRLDRIITHQIQAGSDAAVVDVPIDLTDAVDGDEVIAPIPDGDEA
jgi:hypothetical protein